MTGNNSDSQKVYGLKDPIWYPAVNVIHHFGTHLNPLPADQKNTKVFKKAGEMLVGAVAIVGIQLDGGEPYWIQAVPDSEESPDVRSGRWLPPVGEKAPFFEMQDVEIVGFVPQAGEDIASFLARTKLSKEKAYDARTTVLCHTETGVNIPSLPAITEALRGTGAVCPVIVLGRVHPDRQEYLLFQVHPQFKIIAEYNVMEVLKSFPPAKVFNLSRRGSKPGNEDRPDEKHCPFESLGFPCPLI